ncbi:MAG: hypothetical protein EA392_11195 [Cryomorphaceae bacterium]|nr:MAG: hypothetical protein EA392_11195 [Cryomorphaceae bacterium]
MKHLIFALLIASFGTAWGQSNWEETGYELLSTTEKSHDLMWADNLQNFYLIRDSGLEMYQPGGKMLFKNSQMNLGNITTADFNFSLKPMLFFRELNSIVILDNTLSMQGNPTKLSNKHLNWVTAACKSIDNHYWFFDMQNFELVRTDMSFRRVRSSGNVSQLVGFDINPTFMVEHNNWLYVNNPETGILVFDIFGTYFKQIPISGLDYFQVTDQFILYLRDNQLRQYNLRTFQEAVIDLPHPNLKNALVVKNMLFLSDGKQVWVYRRRG